MDTSNFRYCPICSKQLTGTADSQEGFPRCAACNETFYSAAHPTASALIISEDEEYVLLTRRDIEPFRDWWDIPGGFLEIGESLEQGLRREILEELDVEIEIGPYLGSYPDIYGRVQAPTINTFFIVKIVEGEPVAGSDVVASQWFHRDNLPQDMAFESGRRALAAWQEGAQMNPGAG
jgi:ADP-ribose pyrophosphatase YjhB (NUDIX family)